MSLRQVILSVYLALFAALSVAAGLYFVDAQEEYDRLKSIEARNRRKLDEEEKHLQEQQQTLYRLQHDPDYVERVIRRNLGYTLPDESLFRFDK